MDVSAQARKDELEMKKLKLAMMREEKRKREDEKQKLKLIASEQAKSFEPDDVLRELGITGPAILNTMINGYTNDYEKMNFIKKPLNEHVQNLTLSNITLTNIPPKEKVYYSKGIQINIPTEQEVIEEKSKAVHDYYGDILNTPNYCWDDEFSVLTYANHDDNEYEEHLPTNLNFDGMQPNSKFLKSSNDPKQMFSSPYRPNQLKITDEYPIVEINEEEVLQIISEPGFKSFFDHCTKVVKRVLNDTYDIAIDYSQDYNLQSQKMVHGEKNRLILKSRLFDENYCRNRSVTNIDWNSQYPELLVASYYRNSVAYNKDCDGQVCVWNTRFKNNEPEYVFNFQSTISCVSFAKYHPNLIVGGCYSGQIVVWDNRYNKRTPVQRTPLSVKAHTQRICGLQTVGSLNSHSLITLSTDGKLCDWSSLDSLSTPVSSLDLLSSTTTGISAIPLNPTAANIIPSLSCFAFPSHASMNGTLSEYKTSNMSLNKNNTTQEALNAATDDNLFVVGGEQGSIFSAKRHGIKSGINEIYDSHKGPITEIHFNPSPSPDYSNLFLSSSIDWNIKLWSLKKSNNDIINSLNLINTTSTPLLPKYETTHHPEQKPNSPLLTIDSYEDYIYSVQWSPTNPLTFACGTGSGQLDIWKINHSLEEPIYSEKVTNTALNKIRWDVTGNHICAGDDKGTIWLYDVGQNLNQPLMTNTSTTPSINNDEI